MYFFDWECRRLVGRNKLQETCVVEVRLGRLDKIEDAIARTFQVSQDNSG